MALANNMFGTYTWYPYEVDVEKYRNLVHCIDNRNFYFIQNDELYRIYKNEQIYYIPCYGVNISEIIKMVSYGESPILISRSAVYKYEGLSRYGEIKTSVDLQDIDLIDLYDDIVTYRKGDKFYIDKPSKNIATIEDALCMWASYGYLFKFDGQNIYSLDYHKGLEPQIENKSLYRLSNLGEYTIIIYNRLIIIHPDGSISLAYICPQLMIITHIESDETSITLMDQFNRLNLYARSSFCFQSYIGEYTCLYGQSNQVKSARMT